MIEVRFLKEKNGFIVKNFGQKYLYIFLIVPSFSIAAERRQDLTFSGVRQVSFYASVSQKNYDKNVSFFNIELKKNDNSDDNLFYKIVNITAGLINQIDCNRNSGATIICNAVNPNQSHVDVVFKNVKDIEGFRYGFDAIGKSSCFDQSIYNFSNKGRYESCKNLAKKIVFLDYNPMFGDTVINENLKNGSFLTLLCDYFDYKKLFEHMQKLSQKKEYCFSLVISENDKCGSVTFYKNSIDTVECLGVGLSETMQNLACIMAGSKNNEYLKCALIRFLGERYKVPVFTKKIEELGIEKTHTLYLKYVDGDKGGESYTKLMEDLAEKAENKFKEAENKFKTVNESYNELFNEMTALKAAANKSSFMVHLKDIISMFLSKATGGIIFSLGFTYWLFIKK